MTEYQHELRLNGSVYELNDEFRESLEQRMRGEYSDNRIISMWWKPNEPTLVCETVGTLVPWDDLDQLDADMMTGQNPFVMEVKPRDDDDDDTVDNGNGTVSMPPEEPSPDGTDEIFGRTHFGITPRRYEEVPSPEGDDTDKLPQKPERVKGEELVFWIPRHPEIDHMWDAGETVLPVESWVEWDVQLRADQPNANGQGDTHSRFESLCQYYDCDKVAQYEPSDRIPESSGSVERKGKEQFEDGKFGGENWGV